MTERKNTSRTIKILTAAVGLCCVLLCGFFAVYLLKDNGTVDLNGDTLTILNVGQAKCAVIQSDGRYAVIDAGQDGNAGDILTYLESENVTRIDVLAITHFHTDHTSAVKALLDKYDVGVLLIPNLSAENTPATKFFEMLIEMSEDGKLSIETAQKGEEYNVGNGKIKVLADTVNSTEAECLESDKRINNTSICLSFTQGDFVYVETGDAESDVEKRILNDIPKNVTVFNASHHGSGDSNCKEFLDRLNPENITISCGKDNKYNHPSESFLKLLNDEHRRYYITWQCGDIIFSINQKTLLKTDENENQKTIHIA